MIAKPKKIVCHAKGGGCSEYTNCGNCEFFLNKYDSAAWVCTNCIRDSDNIEMFYHSGNCDRCGFRSAVLVPIV
mgnify:CR=1 FL=1